MRPRSLSVGELIEKLQEHPDYLLVETVGYYGEDVMVSEVTRTLYGVKLT